LPCGLADEIRFRGQSKVMLNGGYFSLGLLSGFLACLFGLLLLDIFDIPLDEKFNAALLGALLGATIGFAAQMLKINTDRLADDHRQKKTNSAIAASIQVKILQALTHNEHIRMTFLAAREKMKAANSTDIARFAFGVPVDYPEGEFNSDELSLALETLQGDHKLEFTNFFHQYNQVVRMSSIYYKERQRIYTEFKTSPSLRNADSEPSARIGFEITPEDIPRHKILLHRLNEYAELLADSSSNLYKTGTDVLIDLTLALSRRDDTTLHYIRVEQINEKLKDISNRDPRDSI